MSQEALIAIVTQETADIEDTDERLREAIEMAFRLLDICIDAHKTR
ncbi:hypothetical protein [Sphingomonas sp. G-3-2-10]|nr:hypothetical protein [Sphingomonas sp. G-3-2-10]NML04249.1 hypothetical protein [Sphingomonas sp. G-3-2-10]